MCGRAARWRRRLHFLACTTVYSLNGRVRLKSIIYSCCLYHLKKTIELVKKHHYHHQNRVLVLV